MQTRLMFEERDFRPDQIDHPFAATLRADLRLDRILDKMAGDDPVILASVTGALLSPLSHADEIHYRQAVLRDCLNNEKAVRELYELAQAALAAHKQGSWWIGHHLPSLFSGSVSLLDTYLGFLKSLRSVARRELGHFLSPGFCSFFAIIEEQLDDNFFCDAKALLHELKFGHGTLLGCHLPPHPMAATVTLLQPIETRRWFWQELFLHHYKLAPRDEQGANDLSTREQLAMNTSIDTLAHAADHVEQFFRALRDELAFYIGGLNLAGQLAECEVPFCIPIILEGPERHRQYHGLYDASLALEHRKMVSNDLPPCERLIYLVSGANQGGKTTFLRSVGQAQLLAQAGLIVPAQDYTSHVVSGIFTHFRQEEDNRMVNGKLDEELNRMDEIVRYIRPRALLLCNESFSSTNEREGAEICFQITRAMQKHEIEQCSVTHLYSFAEAVMVHLCDETCFLRAERSESGERTFRIIEGAPQPTAYGQDLYRKIFRKELVAAGREAQPSTAAS